ncbi:glycosyltransferase family 39 protein [Haloactinomyces albus]|uniref:4-amino-4-deoxy-L-arabinose transferase-like glycosyltransferase n=2 Tax=Haloactinomyces albus TaxID=1352928 RepID=A0AAE3ZBC6_9ACTN|nr:glycosyltransferase family 39 protein [Haloactinomyces albus]MDR7300740.1 4-amino-4-deoxy-L-arabinose transferase-like glycosyltransferase [Haloactinomyces albus]
MITAASGPDMTGTTDADETAASDRPRGGIRYRLALAAVCALAATLYAWGIGDSWGNAYYSAAVKSMSQSFENFLFGSFDAAGVITVDKPPMALWTQVVAVWILGYSPVALLLPQVLEGVAAVLLLHRTVRRWAGEHAALTAALVLALTPITVAINRDNNPDTLLVLLMVAAAYALTRAVQASADSPHSRTSRSGATRWLVLSAFLLGCGFLTKMLQAWIVVPVFVLVYLVGSRAAWPRRLLDLGAAAVTLLVGSFWWVAVTALWPSPKPYIGGSTDGTAWNLIIGYNGLGRIFGQGVGGPGGGAPALPEELPAGMAARMQGGPGGGGGFGGRPGPLRLFNEQLGGQIGWLLPLSGLVLISMLVAAVRRGRGSFSTDRTQAACWVLWGGWLLLAGLVFSFAEGTLHPYYTTMLAPAVAALVGAGLIRFRDWYRQSCGWAWLLLPLGVAVTVVWAVVLVRRHPDWHGWTAYLVGGAGALAVLLSCLGRWWWPRVVGRSALVLSLIAILAVPATWSATTAFGASGGGMGGVNPTAGPATGGPGGRTPGGGIPDGPNASDVPGSASGRSGDGDTEGLRDPAALEPAGGGPMDGGAGLSRQQQRIVDHVSEQAGDRTIPLATTGGAMRASGYIIHSDLTVVGMGGFTGADDAPTVAQLNRWQHTDQLGFVLLGGGPGGGMPGGFPGGARSGGQDGSASPGSGAAGVPSGPERGGERAQWVRESCDLVEPAAYGGSENSGGSSVQLYDCRE